MAQMVVAMAGVMVAVLFDLKFRKVPNALTFSMVAFGIILNVWTQGPSGIVFSSLGLVCGVFFLFLPFSVGGVGGGDVKLMGAVGSLLGAVMTFQIFLATAVFGGLISLYAMFRQKTFGKSLQGIKDRILYFMITRKVVPETPSATRTESSGIPYACAIFCGTLFVLVLFKGGLP